MDENSLQFYLFMISITITAGSFIVGCFLLFIAKRQQAFSEKCLEEFEMLLRMVFVGILTIGMLWIFFKILAKDEDPAVSGHYTTESITLPVELNDSL